MEKRLASLDKAAYAELTRIVTKAGLLERQPFFYVCTFVVDTVLLLGVLAALVVAEYLWQDLLVATLLALVFLRWAGNLHDAAHRQIFTRPFPNDIVGLIAASIAGTSFSWWFQGHNRHHRYPNDEELDPDANVPVLAFSKDQASTKKGIKRLIVAHQAWLIFPLRTLVVFVLKISTINFLRRKQARYKKVEILGFCVHHAVYFFGLGLLLGPLDTLVFVLINYMVLGVVFATIFAPGHKGMTMLQNSASYSFLVRQTITTRNTKVGAVLEFFSLGVAQQIEHHLFPSMPRNNLSKARPFFQAFCNKYNLPYQRTSFWQAQQETFAQLKDVSKSLNVTSV